VTIEFTPDAVMSLTTGDKIIVDETKEDLLRKIIEYKRSVHSGPEVVEWT
jgi:flagellar protein FlbD